MARELVDSMTAPWKPEDYIDDYRERLHDMVERRMADKGNVVHDEEKSELPAEASTNVVDFTALLKQSLAGKSGKQRTPAKSKSKAVAKAPRKKAAAPKSATRSRK